MASWAGQAGGAGLQSTVREYPVGIESYSALRPRRGGMTALMPLDAAPSSSALGGGWSGEGEMTPGKSGEGLCAPQHHTGSLTLIITALSLPLPQGYHEENLQPACTLAHRHTFPSLPGRPRASRRKSSTPS